MPLQERITALAQAIAADIKALQNAPGGAPPPVNSVSVTYTAGVVTSFTEDGVTTSITYNADGTVNTVSYPRGSMTRTETFSYTAGNLTGMTATEA